MNKKGFVLVETLVVVIFVLLIFTILYNSAVPLLGRYKELSYYNDLDTTYDLYYLKKMVIGDDNYSTITNSTNGYNILRCTNGTINNYTECNKLFTALDIDIDDKLLYINLDDYNENTFNNDSNITNEINDYLKFIETNSKILLLEHDGYISYIELGETKTIVSCPGCEFSTTASGYTTWRTGSQTITQVADSSVTSDYTTLGNSFLGLVRNSNKEVTRAYVCGLYNGDVNKPFCIEGYKDGTYFNTNKNLLQSSAYWNGGCDDYTVYGDDDFICSGTSILLTMNRNGYLDGRDMSDYSDCGVYPNGDFHCY